MADFLPPGTLEALGLYLVRTSALVVASPLLGTATGFAGYKVGLIATVSFLLYGATGAPLDHAPLPIEYGCLILREILIGVFLAFMLQAAVVAMRVAGEMIGHEMGLNMATLVDPSTGVNAPVVTQMYEAFFFLGLLAVNGHHLLLRALGASFERAPIGAIEIHGGIAWIAVATFKQMFAAGITFAAPVMVLLALVSILIGLLARAVPQLQVMEVGFCVRIALGLVALLVFAPFLAPALDSLYGQFMNGLDVALDALGSA